MTYCVVVVRDFGGVHRVAERVSVGVALKAAEYFEALNGECGGGDSTAGRRGGGGGE